MKKIISLLVAGLTALGVASVFSGCGKQAATQNPKVAGSFLNLFQADDLGFLTERDLESIACRYYDGYAEVNPYDGKFSSHEELSAETERTLKLAYLQKIVKTPQGSLDKVKIYNYYGTYNGNPVVTIYSDYDSYSSIISEGYEETEIAGVIFKNFWENQIMLFTAEDVPNYEVKGRVYDLKSAIECGLLTENDLKTISCAHFEQMTKKYPDNDLGENPYVGCFEEPKDKLNYSIKTEIKLAYFKYESTYPYNSIYDVKIAEYYGTVGVNIVVSLEFINKGCSFEGLGKTEIHGVTFLENALYSVKVYRVNNNV